MRGMVKLLFGIMATSLFLTESFSQAAEYGSVAGMTGAHNTVRSELGLSKVTWSDELAEFAREWAQYLADRNGCGMRHRPKQGKNALLYGENLYWASAIRLANGANKVQNISPRQVVNSWVSERRHYDHAQNRCRWGKTCGHYTQVVWKTTLRIGCGMATCSDMSQIWVCNYDPPGNYRGQTPY